jgi:hypothetical protein
MWVKKFREDYFGLDAIGWCTYTCTKSEPVATFSKAEAFIAEYTYFAEQLETIISLKEKSSIQ